MSLVKSKIQGIKVDKVVDPSSRFDFPLLNNLAYTDNLVEKYLGKKNFLKEYLGKGTFGYAYLTKNGTVYKFTKNEKEAAASLILFMFGDKLKTQGKIYKVYEVVIGSERLFIIEKEYIKPIGQYIEKEFNLKAYQTYKPLIIIETLLYSRYDNFERFEKEALEKADDEDAETFKIIKELFEKKNKLMRSIFEFNKLLDENEQETGIPLNDQHVGNIGVKDNRVICFDCVTSSKYILKQGGMIKNEIKKSTIKSRLSEPAVKKIGKLGWSKVSPVIWKKIIDEKHHAYINNQGSSYDLVIYDSSKSDKDPIDGGSFGSFEDAEEWLIENYIDKKMEDGGDVDFENIPRIEIDKKQEALIKKALPLVGRGSDRFMEDNMTSIVGTSHDKTYNNATIDDIKEAIRLAKLRVMQDGGTTDKKYVITSGNKKLSSVYTNALGTSRKWVGQNEPGADNLGMITLPAPTKIFVFRTGSWMVFDSIEDAKERIDGWKEEISKDDRYTDEIKKSLMKYAENLKNKIYEKFEDGGDLDREFIERSYGKESVKNIIKNEGLIYAIKSYMGYESINEKEDKLRSLWKQAGEQIDMVEESAKKEGYDPGYLVHDKKEGYRIISKPEGDEISVSNVSKDLQGKVSKANDFFLKILNYVGLSEKQFGNKFENGGDIEKDKRYAVTTDMYSYAPDDQSVIKKSQEFVGDLRKRLDNQASIVEIVEAPFGSIKTRKLENVPKYNNGARIEGVDTKYTRVIPRDLFNESKLLKCVGRLILLIHDNQVPVEMSFDENGDPFKIGLMDEGALTITNLKIFIKNKEYIFKTTYNSKSNYPFYVQHDYVDYRVFDEKGEFDKEFIEFCKTVPKYENGGNIEWEDIPNIDLGFEPSQDWMKLWEDFKRKNKLKVELPHANPKDRGEQSDNAYFMLRHIVAIKRGNWTPDWNNSSEYKYFPWFWMDRKNGFAFCDSYGDYTVTGVGSRLCFPSAELCEAVAREFLPIYKIYFTEK